MLYLVTHENTDVYREELNQALKLRHGVFIEEKGWLGLKNEGGRERDRFDDEHAVHMLYIEAGKVIGYQRMLPSTQPHLLSDVMPELCEGERPVGRDTWEWTRYCVHAAHRKRGRVLSPVANALLSGIVEWGLGTGVSAIIIEMKPLWLLRLVQLHFRVTPLGLLMNIHGEEIVAALASFDHRTLTRLQELRTDAGQPEHARRSVFANWPNEFRR